MTNRAAFDAPYAIHLFSYLQVSVRQLVKGNFARKRMRDGFAVVGSIFIRNDGSSDRSESNRSIPLSYYSVSSTAICQ